MVGETWIMSLVVALSRDSVESIPVVSNGPILRLLRLMRLTRMTRIIRLLRFMPELMVLLRGLAVASRSVLSTFVLLLILIYITAITLCQVKSAVDGPKLKELSEKYF